MATRLRKACKDLNVGITTAVDFLSKKGVEIESNPNFKLGDEEYLLLAKEFNLDMALKLEAKKQSEERMSKEKKESVAIEDFKKKKEKEKAKNIETSKTEISKPKLKKIGRIDLDDLSGKKKKKKQEIEVQSKEPVKEDIVVKTEKTKKEDKKEEIVKEEITLPKKEIEKDTKKETEKVKVVEQEPKIEKETSSKKEEKKVLETVEEEKEKELKPVQEENDEPFRLKRKTPTTQPKVLGSIDLDSINSSTRPAPKTKEQKRKEREEKKLKRGKEEQENKRTSKRKRIKKSKVDVDNAKNSFSDKKKQNKKGKKNRPIKTEVNEEDVNRQIKETLEKLRGKGRGKPKRQRKALEKQKQKDTDETIEIKTIKLTEYVTASELATMMDISINDVIKTCMDIGLMVSINERLDAETINIVAEEFGFTTEYVSHDVIEALNATIEEDSEEDLEFRSPIVTVMGHVDHGKTSLLDYVRNTNVIAGEAGGITQHIGAYNVKLDNGQRITFLDTPGHKAFTAMRARGAKVTDIAIIIIGADDGVMPQTKEAINHASAAGVPIVFAINKIDMPGANPDKIKEELSTLNYLVEDWGGKYQSQEISAKKGIGIEDLLEKVLLEAELLDLKANPNRNAIGSVIEASLDKGRGYISTVLVQNGTLKQGDIVLSGSYYGKIKAMFNERNQRIKEAKPAEPVLILGLNGAPQAGDKFNVVETEQEARDIANKREQLQREQQIRTKKHFTLDELGRRIALGDFQELNIIVKGDVVGSVEALADSLQKLSRENIQVNIIHKAVGAISDSDVMLAAASNAIIVGFQVRPTATAKKMADNEEIDIRNYSIIYDAIEEIKSAMEGMLQPKIKEVVTAMLEVQNVFKISKVGAIAGSFVKEGKVKRDNKVRVIRDGIVIFNGEIESLKHYKDDVKEVPFNSECGLGIKNFDNIQVGDLLETYEEIEIKQRL
ncbi:MAG: translation initiation factor IF-2 [Paludibacter sp.]|nr:MAG: translation initiation factor IF-2 [Paludibacter sp.]